MCSAFPEQWDLPSQARPRCELPLLESGSTPWRRQQECGTPSQPHPCLLAVCSGTAVHIQISSFIGNCLTCSEKCITVFLDSNGETHFLYDLMHKIPQFSLYLHFWYKALGSVKEECLSIHR